MHESTVGKYTSMYICVYRTRIGHRQIRFYYCSASQAQLCYWACLVIDLVKQKKIDRLALTLLTKWAS